MRRPKHRFFIVACFMIILFLHCLGKSSVQTKKLTAESQSDKLILFITSLEKLTCFPCLNPFLDFYKVLPSPFRENRVWGVIIYENSVEKEERLLYEKIVLKKLKGFLNANDIKCPVVLDSFHSFKGFSSDGTTLLVLDERERIMKKYVFPLRKKQIEEILSFLEK